MPLTPILAQSANVLLLDDSDVAGLAMRGIAGRSHHRCVVAASVDEAWLLLQDLVIIDLVVVEPKLKQGDGTELISRIRSDPVFRGIPILVYTRIQDHAPAAKLKQYRIQNYAIQPYYDEVVQREIALALAARWRDGLLEPADAASALIGVSPAELLTRRERLTKLIATDVARMTGAVPPASTEPESEPPPPLQQAAVAAGYGGLARYLEGVHKALDAGDATGLARLPSDLASFGRVLKAGLDPHHVPARLLSADTGEDLARAGDRALWMESKVELTGPVTDPDRLMERVDALPSCPVIDTIAAEFIMAAESRSSDIEYLMDFVCRDPGLSAEMLIAANKADRGEVGTVEHPSVAVGVVGVASLASIARSMPLVQEQRMDVPPLSWPRFWLFQMGVASISLQTAKYLEFKSIEDIAYTAGLLQDLGKLVLLGIHPHGFEAIARYAQARNISMHAAEKAYLGCTSRQIGARFCEKHPLPAPYRSVIQWVESPQIATEHVDLVAVVSLARTLCMHHHVGYCGDTPSDVAPPVDETEAWQVLKYRVFPSFNIRKFDHQIQTHCAQLKQELLGRLHGP